MSKTAIIKSGENYFMKQLSLNKAIVLDQVIFANISGVNGNTDINLNGTMPTASQIVHKTAVTQAGLLNDRTVVYSVILDTNVGDFTFNYIGLVNSATNTLCLVMHTDATKKIKTAGQQQGNTITESLWLEMDNASTSTGVTVNAATWQIDYSQRMAGEDERIRLSNFDMYGRLAINDGMKITKSGTQCTVAAGLAYVAGLRINLEAAKAVTVANNQSLYIDAWLAGTTTGEWSVNYNLIAGTNLKDYTSGIFKHYVERIASVDANGNLTVVNAKSFVTTADLASTTQAGIVKLNSSTNSTSETEAATPLAVKTAYDLANGALKRAGGTMTGKTAYSRPQAINITANNNSNDASKTANSIMDNGGNQWALFYGSDTAILGKTSNLTIASWLGVGFAPLYNAEEKPVNNTVAINTRTGTVNALGGFYEDGKKLLNPINYGIGETGASCTTTTPDSTSLAGGIYGIHSNLMDVNPVANIDSGKHSSALLNLPCSTAGYKFQVYGVCVGNSPRIYARVISAAKGDFSELITTSNVGRYSLPTGIPQPWPTATPPSGWLKCNGATFDKTLYPKLAAAYPTGKLPDLRGEFIRGYDDGRGVDAGRAILSSQGDAIRNITGTTSQIQFYEKITSAGAFNCTSIGASGGHTNTAWQGTNVELSLDVSNVVPTANENRPRNIAFLYIVKAE